MLIRVLRLILALSEVAELTRRLAKLLGSRSTEDPLRRAELEAANRLLGLYRTVLESAGGWQKSARQAQLVAHELALFSRNKRLAAAARDLETSLQNANSRKKVIDALEGFVELLKEEL